MLNTNLPGMSAVSKSDIKVKPFTGDRAKLRIFLVQLKLVFNLNPTKFLTSAVKVMYAALHLKGAAF